MDDTIINEAIADTIGLTEAARDYVLSTQGTETAREGDPMRRLAAIRHSSRLTNLLTNILSWLMWRKALTAGEIDAEELAQKTREFEEAAPSNDADADLPPVLAALIARGDALFERVLTLSRSSG